LSVTFLGKSSIWESPQRQVALEQRGFDPLFLAIRPDADAASRIYRLARTIKRARRFEGELIGLERLHISLFALGWWDDLREKNIARVDRAAAELAVSPFEVTWDRTMSFLNQPDNHAFVLVGDVGVDRLKAFHRSLGAELTRNGLRRWVHTISTPHVTLLYDKNTVDEQPIEPISWTVREFVLVRSRHGQTKHVDVARWQLRG
jgi:RNA 2',3'-cyclic 3'-phosphodiesterase